MPILWQEISLKIPVPNTSAAITLRSSTVTLMYIKNAFVQVVASECIYPRQANTSSCPHFLKSPSLSVPELNGYLS